MGAEQVDSWDVAKHYIYADLNVIQRVELGDVNAGGDDDGDLAAGSTTAEERAKGGAGGEDEGDRVVLPATKEEEFTYPPKQRALFSKSRKVYVRPNVAKWAIFKPEPQAIRERDTAERDSAERDPLVTRQYHEFAPTSATTTAPTSHGLPSSRDNLSQLPPAIAMLLELLPPSHQYQGTKDAFLFINNSRCGDECG